MTTLASLHRRDILKPMLALAAAAPLGISLSPQVALALTASDLDADLLDLGRRWQISADQAERASEALWEIERNYEAPEVPEALFRQPNDFRYFYGYISRRNGSDGRLWHGSPASIQWLGEASLDLVPPTILDDGTILPAKPDLRGRARRDEIITAHDRWTAECEATAAACGLTAAMAEDDAANDANRELRRQIMMTPARTMAGVMLKVRVVARCFGSLELMDDQIDACQRECSITGEAIALSAVRDLVAMQEGAVA